MIDVRMRRDSLGVPSCNFSIILLGGPRRSVES